MGERTSDDQQPISDNLLFTSEYSFIPWNPFLDPRLPIIMDLYKARPCFHDGITPRIPTVNVRAAVGWSGLPMIVSLHLD